MPNITIRTIKRLASRQLMMSEKGRSTVRATSAAHFSRKKESHSQKSAAAPSSMPFSRRPEWVAL